MSNYYVYLVKIDVVEYKFLGFWKKRTSEISCAFESVKDAEKMVVGLNEAQMIIEKAAPNKNSEVSYSIIKTHYYLKKDSNAVEKRY